MVKYFYIHIFAFHFINLTVFHHFIFIFTLQCRAHPSPSPNFICNFTFHCITHPYTAHLPVAQKLQLSWVNLPFEVHSKCIWIACSSLHAFLYLYFIDLLNRNAAKDEDCDGQAFEKRSLPFRRTHLHSMYSYCNSSLFTKLELWMIKWKIWKLCFIIK